MPQTRIEDLRSWLGANQDAAVFCVGASLTPIFVGAGPEGIWFDRIEGLDEVAPQFEAYIEAREAHSFGSGGRLPEPSQASLEELERRYRAGVATPEATAVLDAALCALLERLGEAFEGSSMRISERGVKRLLVLARFGARHFPWGAIPCGSSPLGERFAIAFVETLAPIPRAPARGGTSALYVGGSCRSGSSLALGKAVLSPLSDQVEGPAPRDVLEAMAASARVLRIFAHGTSILLHTDAGGVLLDEDDQRGVQRYSASEARMLDLRGARRVELWACDSGRGDAVFGRLLHHDEPNGLDAAVLLAGAETAVVSLWIQYTLSTAMIAEAFELELSVHPGDEPCALAAAIRRYRSGVAPGGRFAAGLVSHLAASEGPIHLDTALRAGLDAWRRQQWEELRGCPAPELPAGISLSGQRLGPSRSNPAEHLQQRAQLAEQILAPYRSPVAWAGWRVCLRSKEVWESAVAARS